MKSLVLVFANAACISGIFVSLSRPQLSTWIPVMMLFAANVWLTRAKFSDYIYCGHDTRKSVRTLWYVWWAFMAVYLLRQFVENLEVQKERGWAQPLIVTLDLSWKHVVFILSIANTVIWNRRQSYRERSATLLLALGAFAFGNLLWAEFKPMQDDEQFGVSRFEGKDFRWMPPLARSNAFFAYICATAFAAGLAWGVSRLLRRDIRPRNLLISISVAMASVVGAWAAYQAEFRSNAVGVVAALAVAVVPFLRIRAAIMAFLLTVTVVFPLLFFGPMGYMVLEFLSPEKIASASGASGQADATLTYRTFLWEYAAQRLQEPEVFLFGEGPAKRDAQPGYGIFYEGYRMNFHSASIEFLMANGVPLALVGVWCLARMLQLAFVAVGRARAPAQAVEMMEPWIFYFAASLVISIVDPGVATSEGFALVMLPGFGLLLAESLQTAPVPRAARPVAEPRPVMASARSLDAGAAPG